MTKHSRTFMALTLCALSITSAWAWPDKPVTNRKRYTAVIKTRGITAD